MWQRSKKNMAIKKRRGEKHPAVISLQEFLDKRGNFGYTNSVI